MLRSRRSLAELISRLRSKPKSSDVASLDSSETAPSDPPETAPDQTEATPPGQTETAPLDEEAIKDLRQGDIVAIDHLPIRGLTSSRNYDTKPLGAVIVSQTCDAVRVEKPTILLAPVVRLDNDNKAKEARDNKILQYVHLPAAGLDVFVDFSVVATVDKECIVSVSRKPGVDPNDDMAVRTLGKGLGRRLSRFAFPDDVVFWLRPLEKVVQKEHDKGNPEGELLQQVLEFRVQAGKWASVPLSLTLCVIVREGVLPSYADDDGPPPGSPALDEWLRSEAGELRRTSKEIAEKLIAERQISPSSRDIYWLWLALAESWAALCTPDLKELKKLKERERLSADDIERILAAVSSVDADLTDEEGFSTYRLRRSEQVDLDHLSPPLPL